MAVKKKTELGPKAKLMKKNVDQLKRQAKKLKIQGYSTKKKEQLVNSIMMAEARAKRKPGTKRKKTAAKKPAAKRMTRAAIGTNFGGMRGSKMPMVKPKVKMRKPMMSEYNGWSNYETWLINMYFDQYFIDYVTEMYGTDQSLYSQVYEIGNSLQDIVDEMASEVLQGDGTYWIEDLVNKSLGNVNWRELADSTLDSITGI